MGFSIGEAAKRSGCTAPTIRFYEEIGLMRPVGRAANGRRVYTRAEIVRLSFIRRCRDLDFAVERVRALLDIMDGKAACGAGRDLAEAQLEAIRVRRAELDALERSLTLMAGRCTDACAQGPFEDCGMMQTLTGAAQTG